MLPYAGRVPDGLLAVILPSPYWKKAADINTEYSEKRRTGATPPETEKNPTLPGLEESSRDAADLLRERDEELADLSTKNVDPAVTAYVEEDRKLFCQRNGIGGTLPAIL